MAREEIEARAEATYKAYLRVFATGSEAERELGAQYEELCAILDEMDGIVPEETNEGTNWDEWMIDNAIDREREERAAMAYEI